MTKLSTSEIILEYICPALGTVMANLMFAAPYQDLQNAVREGHSIGNLNPTPWAFMLGNCLGWVTYSILLQNLWIFFANCPGFILSIWLNLGAVKLLYQGHYSDKMRTSFAHYLHEQHKQASQRLLSRTTSQRQLSPSTGEMRNIVKNNDAKYNDDNDSRCHHPQHPSSASSSSLVNQSSPLKNNENQDSTCEDFGKSNEKENGHMSVNPFIGMEQIGIDDDNVHDTTKMTTTTTNSSDIHTTQTRAMSSAVPSQPTMLMMTTTAKVEDWVSIVWDVTSQTTPAPTPHEHLVIFMVIIWTSIISLLSFSDDNFLSSTTKELIVGSCVNLNLIFFYGAPLSTIYTVLTTYSSSSIHIPTMITNTLNGSFWTAYGFAVLDPFIYVPNGLGAALGVVQMILCIIFPRKSSSTMQNSEQSQQQQEGGDQLEIEHDERSATATTSKEKEQQDDMI